MEARQNLLVWANQMEKQAADKADVYLGNPEQYPNRWRHRVAGAILGAGLGGGIGSLLGGVGGLKMMGNNWESKAPMVMALLGLLGGGALGGWGGVQVANSIDDAAEGLAVNAEVEREKKRKELREQYGIPGLTAEA